MSDGQHLTMTLLAQKLTLQAARLGISSLRLALLATDIPTQATAAHLLRDVVGPNKHGDQLISDDGDF